MLEEQELALLQAVADLLKEYAPADAIPKINERIASLEAQIKAIPAGPKGDKGDPGESVRGERGEKGDLGESIRGEKGEKGEPGRVGEQGFMGPKGDSIRGEPGERGADGKDGRDGRDGIGKDGRDGLDGQDALQLEILPMIDPEKSYPRGTFAKHDGGLVRATRNTVRLRDTNPVGGQPVYLKVGEQSGWEVIIDGVAEVEVLQSENSRSFSLNVRMTGNWVRVSQFSIPVLIYREIYKDGAEYEPGDVVTHGGSAWHCQTPTKASPAASPAAWKLMVKQGRDGKDGAAGKAGERGAEGPRGRDHTQRDASGATW